MTLSSTSLGDWWGEKLVCSDLENECEVREWRKVR